MIYDALVIGAGMAGLMAAIQAAEKGNKVCLVAKGQGTISLTSGTIDILGCQPDTERVITDNLQNHLAKLMQSRPEHPYALAGQGVIQDSLKALIHITETMGCPYEGDGETNFLLPTAFGTIRPTALAPKTMTQGDVRLAGDVVVLGFEELMDFPARLIADRINQIRTDLGLQGQWRSLRMSLGLEVNNLAYLAKSLEQEENIQLLIEKIKANITRNYSDNPNLRIGIPAIMGLDYRSQFHSKLQNALGCPVFEIPFGQPTIPGLRLNNLLLDYAKKIRVEVRFGTEVLAGRLERGQGEITLNSPGRPVILRGKQIVLATGGSFGKGFIGGPEEFKESIFGLPIEVRAKEGHKGIKVDEKFQPLMKEQGDSLAEAFDGVKVAGRNLADFNPEGEKSGLGVAMVSGYLVGKSIGEGGNHEPQRQRRIRSLYQMRDLYGKLPRRPKYQ